MFANRIFDEMNRLFDSVGFESFPTATAAAYPPINLWEDADHFYIEAEMPGLKLDDIHVTVTEGDQLTIAGEWKPSDKKGTWYRRECGQGRFARTVTLPAAAEVDHASARYEAGVLTLSLPKSEKAKPKRIRVRGGADVPALADSATE